MTSMRNRPSIKLVKAFLDPIFLYLAFTASAVLVGASFVVHQLEMDTNPKMESFFDSLWWGVATMTTIGYGDIVPVTFAGRLVGICLMFTGPVLFVLFTGVLLHILFKTQLATELRPIDKGMRREEREQERIEIVLQQINERLEHLEKK